MFFDTVTQMNKMLSNMDGWLEKAAAYAAAKKVDDAVMLGLRLAPDQLPFARQVQIACDTAKLATARVTGRTPPSSPDTEATFAEVRERIRATRAFLDTFTPAEFEGADVRTVTNPRWDGRTMAGGTYFHQHAVPNFYFHAAHTYAILRNNGVDLGKADYLGGLSFQ
jgi:hypothetical protein